MRLIFAGTPATALPSLQALLDSPHEVVAVLTRPDARSGRGRGMARSQIAQAAEAAGIEVLTPAKPTDPQFVERLAALQPDCIPIVAYGALIPAQLLDVPRWGWVNLHFSLLPAWRGAAPVQHAILAGDEVTGATTFRLDEGMDTGPYYGMVTEQINPRDTTGDLLERLSNSGAELLRATIDGLELGQVEARPQSREDVSYAPKLSNDDLRINWGTPALHIDRLIRAGTPHPGAWTTLRGERLKVAPVVPSSASRSDELDAGILRVEKQAVYVGTTTGPVRLTAVRPAGKKEMPAADWARGLRLASGESFE